MAGCHGNCLIIFLLISATVLVSDEEMVSCKSCFKGCDEENSGFTSLLADPHTFIGDPIDLKCAMKADENQEIPAGSKLELVAYGGLPMKQKILVNNSSMIMIAVDDIMKRPASKFSQFLNVLCIIITPECENKTILAVQFVQVDRIMSSLDEPHVFIDDPIDLKCTVRAAGNQAIPAGSKLEFVTYGSQMKQKILVNNSSMITVAIDDILKRPASDRVIFLYFKCTINTTDCLKQVDDTFLQIDTKPKPVENVSCWSYNWQNMTCQFDLGAYYRNEKDLDVTVFWDYTVYEQFSRCPYQTLNLRKRIVTCEWKANDGADTYKGLDYFFKITVKNKLRNYTVTSHIKTQNIVKPAPVKDVKIGSGNRNGTSMTLTWRHSSRISSLRYTITYCSEYEEKCKKIFQSNPSVNLMELTPYTNYTIQVTVVPIDSSGKPVGYCSEPTVITARTNHDAPAHNPKMSPGFFDCITSSCDKVHIYFTPLQQKELNGPFEFVNVTFYYQNKTGFFLTVNDRKKSSVLASNVCPTCKIRVEARQKNTLVGYSRQNPSYLLMYPLTSRPNAAETELVVEALADTRVKMKWKMMRDEDITNYSLCWCLKSRQDMCEGQLHCKVIRKTVSEFDVTLHEGTFRDYKFGISVEKKKPSGDIFSSGILWNTCTYYKYGIPKQKPSVTTYSDKTKESRELRLSWKKYTCDPDHGPVLGYRITYCWKKLKNCTDVDVDPQTTNYTIQDLQDGEYTYLINGIFNGEYGKQFGPSYNGSIVIFSGEDVIRKSLSGAESSPTVIIVIAVSVSALLVVCVVVFILCKVRKHDRRLGEETRQIDMPEIASNSSVKPGLKNDSGIGGSSNDSSGSMNKKQQKNGVTPKPDKCDTEQTPFLQNSKPSDQKKKNIDQSNQRTAVTDQQSAEVTDYCRQTKLSVDQQSAYTSGKSADPQSAYTSDPSAAPSSAYTSDPSAAPSSVYTSDPSAAPSSAYTSDPSAAPSSAYTSDPSAAPSSAYTSDPSAAPSSAYTSDPSAATQDGIYISDMSTTVRTGDGANDLSTRREIDSNAHNQLIFNCIENNRSANTCARDERDPLLLCDNTHAASMGNPTVQASRDGYVRIPADSDNNATDNSLTSENINRESDAQTPLCPVTPYVQIMN